MSVDVNSKEALVWSETMSPKSKNEHLLSVLKPFAELGAVILSEAPAESGYFSVFLDSSGKSHRITLDQFRAAALACQQGATEK